MAGRRDRVMEELTEIRRRFSSRLYTALCEGRLEKEVRTLEREGLRASPGTPNGTRTRQQRTK